MKVRVLSYKKIKLSDDINVSVKYTDVNIKIHDSIICRKATYTPGEVYIVTEKSHRRLILLVSKKLKIKKKYIHTYVRYDDIIVEGKLCNISIIDSIEVIASNDYLDKWLIRRRDEKLNSLLR